MMPIAKPNFMETRAVENPARAIVIPIVKPKFIKSRTNENPLLKVPPASRGNRTRVRFPSRSGGNLQEGGNS